MNPASTTLLLFSDDDDLRRRIAAILGPLGWDCEPGDPGGLPTRLPMKPSPAVIVVDDRHHDPAAITALVRQGDAPFNGTPVIALALPLDAERLVDALRQRAG